MATISVCMIVKNEARNLVRTLPNWISSCDEVIVVDTGSSDNTPELALQMGARVESFVWQADFSAARNFSLTLATGDWVFWPDADEWVNPEEVIHLKQFLDTYQGYSLGIPIAECMDGTFEPDHRYYRAKLFKNRMGIGFSRPFNEQVSLNGKTLFPEQNTNALTLFHWGGLFHLPQAQRDQKIQRNHDILLQLMTQFPNDPGYLYSLAMTTISMSHPNPSEAARLLIMAHQHCPDPQFDQLIMFKLGQILFLSGDHHQLDECMADYLTIMPDFVPFLNLKATRLMMAGNYEQALAVLMQVINVMGTQTIAEQVDPNEYASIPYEKLGLTYLGLGQFESAKIALYRAIELNPNGNGESFLAMVEKKEQLCQ